MTFYIAYTVLLMLLGAAAIFLHSFQLSCFSPTLAGLITGQNFSIGKSFVQLSYVITFPLTTLKNAARQHT